MGIALLSKGGGDGEAGEEEWPVGSCSSGHIPWREKLQCSTNPLRDSCDGFLG